MKVDFYVYETTSTQRVHFAACALLEKMYAEPSQHIYVHMNTRDEAERLDNLLWTYRDDSFIPHSIYQADQTQAPRIQIGYTSDVSLANKNILMNFATTLPLFYSEFAHIIEMVFTDPITQQAARERYKQYRDQGFSLNTIKLKVSTHD